MSMAIQRSKYTGDPGIWDVFKGVAKVGLGFAGGLPIVGGAAQYLGGRLFPPAPGTTTYAQNPYLGIMPNMPTGMPGSGASPGCAPGRAGAITAAMQAARGRGDTKEAAAFQRELAACGPGRGAFTVDPLAFLPGGRPLFSGVNGGVPAMENGMMAGRPAVAGYHWNKSGYFLQSGEYVPAGTKMVKNRRRNPANPRATSNAITRIKGAKRYAKSLSSISIRKKKC